MMPHWLVLAMDSWRHTDAVAALLGKLEVPVTVPSAQWPWALLPQQVGARGRAGAGGTAPRPVSTGAGPGIPHVATLPSARKVQVAADATCVGVLLSVAVPSPSCPPFPPQQNGLPAEVMAHDRAVPAAMLAHVFATVTDLGTGRLMSVPSPSWPLLLYPWKPH